MTRTREERRKQRQKHNPVAKLLREPEHRPLVVETKEKGGARNWREYAEQDDDIQTDTGAIQE